MIRRNLFYLYALMLFVLSGSLAYAQKAPKIKGNRIVAPYSAPIDAFHSLVLDQDINLNIMASDSSSVSMIADDNLPPIFKFEVQDSVLHISTYYRITAAKQLDMTLHTPRLDLITISEGNLGITLDPRFKNTEIRMSGNASAAIVGTIPSLRVSGDEKSFVNISGAFELLHLSLSDRSTATIYGDISSAQLNMEARASAKWGGTLAFLTASLSGVTQLEAADLIIEEASVHAAGKSKLDLQLSAHLTYFATEESQLDLFGTPRIDLLDFSGTAEMRKKQLK